MLLVAKDKKVKEEGGEIEDVYKFWIFLKKFDRTLQREE